MWLLLINQLNNVIIDPNIFKKFKINFGKKRSAKLGYSMRIKMETSLATNTAIYVYKKDEYYLFGYF